MIDFIIIFILYIYLILCCFDDIRTKKISVKICLIFLFAGLVINIIFTRPGLYILFCNLAPGVFLFLISKLTKGAIGCGDAVIFIIMSFYMQSVSIFPILFLSLLAASMFSIILIIKKYSRKYVLPFAPFITLGFTVFLLMQLLEIPYYL